MKKYLNISSRYSIFILFKNVQIKFFLSNIITISKIFIYTLQIGYFTRILDIKSYVIIPHIFKN